MGPGSVRLGVTTTAPESAGSPTVRRAVRADLLAVYQIERTAFPQPWPYSAFERFLEEPGFLVAVHDGENGESGIVGFVVADAVPNHGRPLGHVKDLAVHPEYRGEGTGKRLFRRALGVLDANGVASVKLEVRASNDRALSLYRQFGFTHARTVPNYYDDGEDAFVLRR